MNSLFCLKLLLCLFLPRFLSLRHRAKYPAVQEIVGACMYVCVYACMLRKSNSQKLEAVVEGHHCLCTTNRDEVGGLCYCRYLDEAQKAIAESMGPSPG